MWTTVQCGSPFGLATASFFHSNFFDAATIAQIDTARNVNQSGWLPMLAGLLPSVSPAMVGVFGVIAWAALTRKGIFRILLALVVGQSVLIAWLLPHDFRFLGGLQFVVLTVATCFIWSSRFRAFATSRWWVVLIALCLPWLAAQVYYARPFVAVDSGRISRESFLERYVAFTDDFRALNRILPANAVIYVVNSRLPSYYAPRPVVFTLSDLRGRGPLYRFAVGDVTPEDTSLNCGEAVYENRRTNVVVFRTPGRPLIHGSLVVQRCFVSPSK